MNYEPNTRYIIGTDGEFVRQTPVRKTKSRSNRDLVVEGVGTRYNEMLYVSGDRDRYVNLQPGCFGTSIKYDVVHLWLDHSEKLAMPGVRVELYSTETELNFRAHLDSSELAGHARDLVEAGLYTNVSLGWDSSVISKRRIGEHEVHFILSGKLREVSLLPRGACANTHVQVSRLADCRSLRDDVESKKFAVDNSWAELKRKLSALENQL